MNLTRSLSFFVVLATTTSQAFTPSSNWGNGIPSYRSASLSSSARNVASSASGQGFAPAKQTVQKVKTPEELKLEAMALTPIQLKANLLDVIPKMMGTPDEFRLVESYVNALEDKFVPPQTLGFLNMAMVGDWQFLFTTNQIGRPSPHLRLTELVQRIECENFDGKLTNEATWDLSEDGTAFESRGKFTSSITYNINQGARMTINEDHDLTVNLAKGSKLPSDTQELVGLIRRAMPVELFDPSDLALDTTYLDTELRIVRFTGERHEGVRNIFIRRGAVEINPVSSED